MSSTSSTSSTEPTHHADRLGTVDRMVASGSRDGADTKTVTVSQSYPVGIDDLWSAVTDSERISRWLMPISGDLRLGGHYQLEGNAGGTIEECVPRERIAVTWEFAGEVSWVVATLSGGHTESALRVEHVAHVDAQRWEEYGPGAVGIGWDSMLLGLTLHLESGSGMDREEAAAWVASDDGRAFMRGSGDAWCRAQVDAGEDEAAARAAADRCIAAYLG
ncbi:MAG TPA: SRPBCC domain-containing protein [Humibacillus xanthopallidus]|nr:SRPBCC domain-containing protein [Humibacillus xanthopallidus]